MINGLDETHAPSRSSWVEGADHHADFPVQNLPYGVFSPEQTDRRAGVAIGLGPCHA
jgi:fumarylacetoacetase